MEFVKFLDFFMNILNAYTILLAMLYINTDKFHIVWITKNIFEGIGITKKIEYTHTTMAIL